MTQQDYKAPDLLWERAEQALNIPNDIGQLFYELRCRVEKLEAEVAALKAV